MVQILNVFQRATSLLASQFRSNSSENALTNFQKLIRALTVPMQLLENIKWQLKTERSLDTAIGKQLDLIGEILGLPRNEGETDDSYRDRLRLQAFINTSKATPEDAIKFLKMATKANVVSYQELKPACFQLETDGTFFPDPPNMLNEYLKKITPAGVNYVPITATYGTPIPFTFSHDDISNSLLTINHEIDEESNLLTDPYNKLLEVTVANNVLDTSEGGFDEYNYPIANAGMFCEAIQYMGNFPPRRYQ